MEESGSSFAATLFYFMAFTDDDRGQVNDLNLNENQDDKVASCLLVFKSPAEVDRLTHLP